jgi:hypothetical protein
MQSEGTPVDPDVKNAAIHVYGTDGSYVNFATDNTGLPTRTTSGGPTGAGGGGTTGSGGRGWPMGSLCVLTQTSGGPTGDTSETDCY